MAALILVGADKGGVGKTMLARALLDHLERLQISVRAFDTEPAPGVLKRFHPSAEIANVDELGGQMKIFDGIDQAQVTVVDLHAGSLSTTLRAMRNAGLLDDATRGAITLIVVHVLGASVASLTEIADTAAQLAEGGTHFLIKNRASDGQFFEWDKATSDSFFKAIDAAAILDIPHLDAIAAESVDRAGLSFSAFISARAATNGSRMIAGVVRHWLGLVAAEFDRVGLPRRVSSITPK